MIRNYQQETLCVQAGYKPKNGEARILPLYQSTTYKYDSADEVGKLFDLEVEGHMYSRISNPTVEALEKKLSAMEGGIGAVCTSSGQSATLLSILTICQCGQHVLAMNNLYGGTYTLFTSTLKKFGIEVSFIDLNSTEAEIKNAIRPNTRLIFGETIGNPGVEVIDIKRLARVAHENNIPLIIDNTFATPYLCRPIEFGADIVIHSTTKYIDGHATSVGGIVIDSGKFNWNNGDFPELVSPDPSYHGLSYTEKFGKAAYITKLRVAFLRDIGNTMSPFNAFLTNLGVETLALRMQRHSENALEMARFLEKHPFVSWINYPYLESSKSYEFAKKYLAKGGSGVISFGVKGGVEAGKKFIDNLQLASLVVHVGDIRTHVLHPASMTHRQLSEEQQIQAGIRPEMIRFSVGIEDIEDIKSDIAQALDKIN
jgi:O-acetylhomoserine (thiol)-lyase